MIATSAKSHICTVYAGINRYCKDRIFYLKWISIICDCDKSQWNLGPIIMSLAEVSDLCLCPIWFTFGFRTIVSFHYTTIKLGCTIRITVGSEPLPLIPNKSLLWWGWLLAQVLGFGIIMMLVFCKRSCEPREAGFFKLDNITSGDA